MLPDFLLTLPTSLVCRVLCDWLENQDLPRLDSAYCSQYQRGLLFDVFRSEEFALETAGRGDMIRFVFKRGIKVSVLALDSAEEIMNRKCISYLQQNKAYIHDLTIDRKLRPTAVPLFHNLKSLKFMNTFNLPQSCLLTLLKNNPCLESVELHTSKLHVQSTDISKLHLPHLRSLLYFDKVGAERILLPLHSPLLVKLNVKKYGEPQIASSSFSSYIPEVASRCPNLRTLCLYNLFSASIATLWPNIVHLSICQSQTLSDSHVLFISQNLKHLRVVNFPTNTIHVTPRAVQYLTQYCSNTLEIMYLSLDCATFPLTDTQRTMCRNLHTFGWYPTKGASLIILHCGALSLIPWTWNADMILEILAVVQDTVEVVDFSHCMCRAYSTFTSPLPVFLAAIGQYPRLRQINMGKYSAKVEIRELLKDRPDLDVTSQKTEYSIDVMKLPV